VVQATVHTQTVKIREQESIIWLKKRRRDQAQSAAWCVQCYTVLVYLIDNCLTLFFGAHRASLQRCYKRETFDRNDSSKL
jgi:hypothetical protein